MGKRRMHTLIAGMRENYDYAHSLDAKDHQLIDYAKERDRRVRKSGVCLFTFSDRTRSAPRERGYQQQHTRTVPGIRGEKKGVAETRFQHSPPHFRLDAKSNRVPACILLSLSIIRNGRQIPTIIHRHCKTPSSRLVYSLSSKSIQKTPVHFPNFPNSPANRGGRDAMRCEFESLQRRV